MRLALVRTMTKDEDDRLIPVEASAILATLSLIPPIREEVGPMTALTVIIELFQHLSQQVEALMMLVQGLQQIP